MDLKELESGVDPNIHWYYQTKRIPLFRFFNNLVKKQNKAFTIIDFGAGSGFFSIALYEAFPNKIKEVLLIDIGYTQQELSDTAQSTIKKLHYIPQGVEDSVVLMMDVLEHIEDDHAIIKDIKHRLGANAYYFITVPAFKSMWSGHDVFLGHFRRYTIKTLRQLLISANISSHANYYIYGTLFPAVWIVRRLKRLGKKQEEVIMPQSSDMKPLPNLINNALKHFLSLMMNFRKINKLCGVSVVSEGKIK